MRINIAAALLFILGGYTGLRAGEGLSVLLAMEYNPLARLSYQNGSEQEYDIVDNISWEPGIYYNFTTGFRTGGFFQYYRKDINPAGTTELNLSSWGIGILTDYGYEITESGRTLLVAGMETGYGELSDKNVYSNRTGGSIWIAGLAGMRYYFTPGLSVELDYRIKWHQYDLSGTPAKSYDFSGSTLRLSLGYRIFSTDKKSGDEKDEKASFY
jgi:hypothetical protein